MVFSGERSNSEDYAPEIATQKIKMNIASRLNIKSREAEERPAKRFSNRRVG